MKWSLVLLLVSRFICIVDWLIWSFTNNLYSRQCHIMQAWALWPYCEYSQLMITSPGF